ncbi:MAG: sterol desaturase family protein [Chitinophagaceae bacterium]|nr:sterol desaturase family protein [Chitinophagaceae bacterium]
MESYGKILLIAMPAFLVLVLIEKWYGWKKGFDTLRNMDTISSLTSGVTNVTKDVLKLSIGIITYQFMLNHLAFFTMEAKWYTYALAFVFIDFQGYWVHRWSHAINLFWNRHIIHHSSEEYNLACALRQSISSFFELFTFLLLPAALLGVPQNVIAIVAPLQLFAQFWYHTRHIGQMGFLEKIIVTPSHHRVHHAMNAQYMDKNFSQIFIFWDKLFGTFQQELKEVPAVYGITRPAKTWNPIKINFQHLWLLISDAWHTKSIADKLRIWFMPTGWRPKDVADKYPVYKVDDVYHFAKYDTKTTPALNSWAWFQLIMLLLFLSYFFSNIAQINAVSVYGIYLYGLFVFLYVYALTELMDRNSYAIVWEFVKNIFALSMLYYFGDWFISDTYGVMIKYIVFGYIIISFACTYIFGKNKK